MKRIYFVLASVFVLLASCNNIFHSLSSKDSDNHVVVIGARWEYKVDFDKNGGDTEADPPQIMVWSPAKTTGDLPAEPRRKDHGFAGWNSKADGSGTVFKSDTNVTENITVYAQWSLNKYTVTFNSDGGGVVSAQTVPQGGRASAPNPPPTKSGFTFLHWYNAADRTVVLGGGVNNITMGYIVLGDFITAHTQNFLKEPIGDHFELSDTGRLVPVED